MKKDDLQQESAGLTNSKKENLQNLQNLEKAISNKVEIKNDDGSQTITKLIENNVDKLNSNKVQRLTLWQRIVKEIKHYSDGFKLLYFETKIAYGLLKKVIRGETLSRRERRQVFKIP